MKKIFRLATAFMVMMLVSTAIVSSARPIYIGGIKIAIRAKWSITFKDCQDGKGICISIFIGEGPSAPDVFIGYDKETDKICLKIGKREKESAYFSGGTYEVQEDSPIDRGVIGKMTGFPNFNKTVVIKKGIYKVIDEGDYYVVALDYYLQ